METPQPQGQPSTATNENVKVIAERKSAVSDRVARLVKVGGKVMCECPYACMAAMETCEFDAEFNWENEENPIKRFLKAFRLKYLA